MNLFPTRTKVIDLKGTTPKFEIGQTVYIVKEYRLERAVIQALVYTVKKDKVEMFYTVRKDSTRVEDYAEAWLLGTLEEAIQAAKTNWEVIDSRERQLLATLSEKDFDELKKKYEERIKASKKK